MIFYHDDPFVLALLVNTYVSAANTAEALKILDQMKVVSGQRYVPLYLFALVYVGLGEREEALSWLEQSYQERAGADIGWIRVEPLLDPLCGDPRFEAIAEKIVPAKEFKAAPPSK